MQWNHTYATPTVWPDTNHDQMTAPLPLSGETQPFQRGDNPST
jgi:hypothetical protein